MLIFFALGTLLGATVLSFFSTLPQVAWVEAIFFMVTCATALGIRFTTQKFIRQALVLLLGAVLGFGWAFKEANTRLAWQFPKQDTNRLLQIEGNVVGVVQLRDQTLTFDVALSHYNLQSVSNKTPARIRLYWKNPPHLLFEGDKLSAQVKLKPLWHLANPGGFDQEKQFFIEQIRATGKIIALQDYQKASHFSLNQTRQTLSQQIADLLGNKPFVGVIQAMTLGINTHITPSQWKIFQATGTTHIVCISGSHIGLVAMLFFGMVTKLVKRSHWLTTLYPANCYGALAGLVSGLIYSALAGFSIPTMRACMMILVTMIAILKKQPVLSWYTLTYSWLAILMIDPLATLQMGFWLSFGCVAALILGKNTYDGGSRWLQWTMPQWIVFIGLLPMSILFFQQAPLYSPIANFVALPMISFIVVPASLLALALLKLIPALSLVLFEIAHQGMVLLGWLLEKIVELPLSVWYQAKPPAISLCLAFVSAFFLLLPKGVPARRIAALGLLPLFLYRAPLLNKGECHLTIFDVGQGLACFIQTQHHTLLYDAGPQYGAQSNAGERIIKPFLLTRGSKTLDKMIISHGDLDHRAGIAGLTGIHILDVITSEPHKINLPARRCIAGESWEWDGVLFTILSPIDLTAKKRNDLSCVLRVATKHHSILLTGDIEAKAEALLIKNSPQLLASDILLVPHHGSLTSSSAEFVKRVAPRYAVFPVGFVNQYGFPKDKIIQRYQEQGSQNLLVWQTGALLFKLNRSNELTPPTQWRETSHHYWHGFH